MSDEAISTPPPLPSQPAAVAARAAAYNPATDPDDTGVPTIDGRDAGELGRGFLRALFDISFRTFITRRLASVFYLVGLVVIAIAFVVAFVLGVVRGSIAVAIGVNLGIADNIGGGISLIVATIVIAPLLAFLSVVVLRFVIEAIVALIAIAENTERTAANTRH